MLFEKVEVEPATAALPKLRQLPQLVLLLLDRLFQVVLSRRQDALFLIRTGVRLADVVNWTQLAGGGAEQ